jgi:hypothetical protein
MGARIDWFGLAEGVAADARGAMTLVGFSPDFLLIPDLPGAQTVFWVLVLKDDDGEPALVEGAQLSVDIQVYGPDGRVVGGSQQVAGIAAKRHPELPGSIIFSVGMRLTFHQYGEHKAAAEVTVAKSQLKAERIFYIMEK